MRLYFGPWYRLSISPAQQLSLEQSSHSAAFFKCEYDARARAMEHSCHPRNPTTPTPTHPSTCTGLRLARAAESPHGSGTPQCVCGHRKQGLARKSSRAAGVADLLVLECPHSARAKRSHLIARKQFDATFGRKMDPADCAVRFDEEAAMDGALPAHRAAGHKNHRTDEATSSCNKRMSGFAVAHKVASFKQ